MKTMLQIKLKLLVNSETLSGMKRALKELQIGISKKPLTKKDIVPS